jgi:hypothetical protein
MASFTHLLPFLAYICLGAADLAINTDAPLNPCLKLNPTFSADKKLHVVKHFNLQKCCRFGWHLDLSKDAGHGGVPCVEGDQNITIDMVFIENEGVLGYEPLKLSNYSVHVSSLFKRSE